MNENKVIREFPARIKMTLGERIKKIVLFGSYARGDSGEGSDYDFLLIVDKRDDEIEDRIIDLQVEMLDLYDALVASIIRTPEDWAREQGLPLGINVAKEGVVL